MLQSFRARRGRSSVGGRSHREVIMKTSVTVTLSGRDALLLLDCAQAARYQLLANQHLKPPATRAKDGQSAEDIRAASHEYARALEAQGMDCGFFWRAEGGKKS